MPEGATTATQIVTWNSSGFRVILNGKYNVVIIDIHCIIYINCILLFINHYLWAEYISFSTLYEP
jgi:hypothetical protein